MQFCILCSLTACPVAVYKVGQRPMHGFTGFGKMTSFVTYLRVSTVRQGASGLGIEAQRAAVAAHVAGGNVIAELVEVESGAKDDRVQLAAAIRLCRRHKATLLIAKLDRLARDAAFLLTLAKQLDKAGVDFKAADMPTANRLTIGIMACVAEEERKMIGARTKAALAAAKARGVKLGGDQGGRSTAEGRAVAVAACKARADERAGDVLPLIVELRAEGVTSLGGLARALTERQVAKARGGLAWSPTDVKNLLARAA